MSFLKSINLSKRLYFLFPIKEYLRGPQHLCALPILTPFPFRDYFFKCTLSFMCYDLAPFPLGWLLNFCILMSWNVLLVSLVVRTHCPSESPGFILMTRLLCPCLWLQWHIPAEASLNTDSNRKDLGTKWQVPGLPGQGVLPAKDSVGLDKYPQASTHFQPSARGRLSAQLALCGRPGPDQMIWHRKAMLLFTQHSGWTQQMLDFQTVISALTTGSCIESTFASIAIIWSKTITNDETWKW